MRFLDYFLKAHRVMTKAYAIASKITTMRREHLYNSLVFGHIPTDNMLCCSRRRLLPSNFRGFVTYALVIRYSIGYI